MLGMYTCVLFRYINDYINYLLSGVMLCKAIASGVTLDISPLFHKVTTGTKENFECQCYIHYPGTSLAPVLNHLPFKLL